MKKIALLSAVAMVGLTQAANASVVTFSVNTAGIAAYNNTVAYTPQPFALTPVATKGVVYEVPVMFQLEGLAAGRTFGNVAFDVFVNNDLSKNTGPGASVGTVWYGNDGVYPSGKGTEKYFDSNSDAGSNTKDGLDIAAYINAGTPSAQRQAMGIGSPFLLGWAYVLLPSNATTNSTITITPRQFSYSENGVLTQDPSAQFVSGSYTFIVPEPASIGMAGIGALGLLARRRRA